jgi:DNA polymerase I-like protein with 3'-5' exonuclease and polymerase domains
MGFFDGPLSKDTDIKHNNKVLKNPILYKNSDTPDFYILLEKAYNKGLINKYAELIKKESPNAKFQILSILSLYARDKEMKGGIENFYVKNKIPIHQYIPPFSKVIADRRSVVALNESDDLDVKGFYDIVFNDSFYYNPQYKLTVFPVDPITYWLSKNGDRILEKDTWTKFFHFYQIKHAQRRKVSKQRHKKIHIETVDNPNEFLIEKGNDKDCEFVAWDIETNSLDPWAEDSKILELTMSFDGVTGYYLSWDKIDTKLLSDFFCNKKQILQNGKFDIKFLVLNGVDRDSLSIYHDTWNGMHTLNEMQKGSLKTGVWLDTDMGGYDNELENYKKRYPSCRSDYSKIPVHVRKPYAVKDSIATFRLFQSQVNKFKEMDKRFPNDNPNWTLEKYFYQSVMPTVNMFIDVELEGMLVDWDKLKELSTELQQNIKDAEREVWKAFGVKENIISLDSGPELGVFLEMYGLPVYERGKQKPNSSMVRRISETFKDKKKEVDTEKGVLLTGDALLTKWKKAGYAKEIDALLKYRELTTLYKTFVGSEEEGNGFFQYRKKDNRLHSTFGPMLTQSHRNWSREPNLQNLVKHGEKAKWWRQIFIPPGEDYYISEPDGAGLQLRIGAILSGDKTMRDAFESGNGDIHSKTANKVLMNEISEEEFLRRIEEGDKTAKSKRFKSKGINFSLEFGSTAYSFAKQSIEPEWSLKECRDYIKENNLSKKLDNFKRLIREESKGEDLDFAYYWAVASNIRKKHFEVYNGLKKWTERIPKKAEKQGYVRSPFGAIRRLPEVSLPM